MRINSVRNVCTLYFLLCSVDAVCGVVLLRKMQETWDFFIFSFIFDIYCRTFI